MDEQKKSRRSSGSRKPRKSSGKSKSYDFDIAFSDIVSMLRRRAWLVAGCAAVSIGIAALYMAFSTRWYESNAQILVEQRDPNLAAEGSLSSNGSNVSEDLMATHLKLVQSRRIIGMALERSRLDQLQSIIDRLDVDELPVDYVLANLNATSGGDGNARDAHVLNLSLQHVIPEETQLILDAIVKEYQLFLQEKYKDTNTEAARLIEQARGEIQKELERLEEEYRKFRETAPVIATGETGANVFEQRYEEIQAEISDVDSSITEASARLKLVEDGLQRMKASNVPELQQLTLIDAVNAERMAILVAVDRGEAETAVFQAAQPERMAQATSEFTSLLEKKSKLQSMEQNLGKNHPDVVALRGEIALADTFVKQKAEARGTVSERPPLTPKDVMDAYVTMLRNDVQALMDRKQGLIALAAETETQVKGLVDFELTGEYLLHERERQQGLFDSTVDNLRAISMATEGGGFIDEVIEAPEIGKLVAPNGLIAGCIVILGTLLLGTICVGMVELSDRSFHKPEELEGIFGAPLLSHVPELNRDLQTRKIMATAKKSDSSLDQTLVSFFAPRSRISEVFRGMRTQMLFSAGGDQSKIIGVTSAKSGEGKSTVSANLAISLSQTGRDVLLVDCDLRRPRVHKLFASPNSVGLSDVLTGKRELSDAISATEVPHLSTLTSGPIPENPAELLDSENFTQLLGVLREKFDIILLDCPPVLPVSDPAIVAPKVDGMVVVIRIDSECRPQASRVQQILAGVDARILGLVVNRSTETKGRYAYNAYGYEAYNSGLEYYHTAVEENEKNETAEV